jgi:predicted lactoylglutathione lyase
MKVFISHSMRDANMVNALSSIAKSVGVDIHQTITKKIEDMILDSSLVIVVLTKAGFDSNFVQQEIGYAKDKKAMLILVEKGLENKISGFIFGYDYISVDVWNPHPAYDKIQEILTKEKQSKEQKEAVGALLLVGLGILFLGTVAKG